MGKRMRLIFLSVILMTAMTVLGNLIDTKSISPQWSILVIILFLTLLGIGLYGFITYTVSVYKRTFNRAKSAVFRAIDLKGSLKYRGEYNLSQRKNR